MGESESKHERNEQNKNVKENMSRKEEVLTISVIINQEPKIKNKERNKKKTPRHEKGINMKRK